MVNTALSLGMGHIKDKAKRSPIDQGWAWVVLMACFLALVSVGGGMYSVSITNVVFLQVFKQSKAITSWAGALHSSLMQIAGKYIKYCSKSVK